MNSLSLRCLAPRPMARLRLVCAPYAAAGAAAFRGWAEATPAWIEPYVLRLPGREDALGAPAHRSWEPMIAEADAAVAALPPGRLAFFGHSLGALIAFDLARRAEKRGSSAVARLFCAARPWPGSDPATTPSDAIAEAALSDDALLSELSARYGPAPASLSDPEIRDMALPILRADLALLADYAPRAAPPLACPITVFAGRADPIAAVSPPKDWLRESAVGGEVVWFDDGHYFLEPRRAEIVADISAKLSAT